MQAEEIHKKLRRSPNSHKPGELAELSKELFLRVSYGIDPEMAGELADIVYYSLQPNARPEDTLNAIFESEAINFVGIPLKVLLDCCLVKYSTRLTTTKGTDPKKEEHANLQKYLDAHPDLKELRKVTPPIFKKKEETIWEHIFESQKN